MDPKISIIIPCFNNEDTIGVAIESCLQQTEKSLEVLVIDDHSIDNSLAYAHIPTDQRLHIFELPHNLGVSHARNYGIKRARGTWIQFLDADDFLHREKLEKQLQNTTESDLILSGWIEIVGENITEVDICQRLPNSDSLLPYFIDRNPLAIHAPLIRKSLIDKAGGFSNQVFHEDWEFWVRIISGNCAVSFVNTPLCTYQRRVSSKNSDPLKSMEKEIECLRFIQSQKYAIKNNILPVIATSLRNTTRGLIASYYIHSKPDQAKRLYKDYNDFRIVDHLEIYFAAVPFLRPLHGKILGPKKIYRHLKRCMNILSHHKK